MTSGSYLERVVRSCEQRSEKIAMRVVGDDSQVYTFGEMLRQIRSVAYNLRRENIAFGDRVVVIGENHPSWAVAYLATLYHGAVCVPLDPHGEIETLANFFENSEAKLAFVGAEVADKVAQIQQRTGRHVKTVVWTSAGGADFADWASSDFPAEFAAERPRAAGGDVALLIYTSGTTGTPKGVPLTHGNIVAELDGINDVLELTDKEKILSLLPLFHAYLQIVNLWVATTYGCEVGYLKELSPAELSSAMREFKPTILTTVPRLWYLFHKKIFDAVAAKPRAVQTLFRAMLAANGALRDTIGVNLGPKLFSQVHESFGGRLRLAISGGSRFDEDAAKDFHKLGFTILQGYGLTETSGAATATFVDDNRVGSVGKPMRGTEVKIDHPDKDGVGEVLIRGGVVFGGYYKNPQATAEAFTEDGWFRSGDLGRFDRDGHLYIVGRAKDVIVLPSGKNVHPEDLEAHYLKTPLVEEMAIIGISDASEQRAGAEKLAAVVVPDFEYLRNEKIANSREAIRYALDNLGRELPEYQRVRDYIIRAEPLPRTATRKVKRFELKKQVESGAMANGGGREPKEWQFSTADSELLASPAGAMVAAAVRQNAKDVDVIHPDMNLEIDLGLDSLARAETFAALEHSLATEFNGDEAAQALTVREVIKLVNAHSADAPTGDARSTSSLIPHHSSLAAHPSSLAAMWPAIVRQTPADVDDIRPILKKRIFFTPFAFAVYKLFYLFFLAFTRLEVRGLDELKSLKRPFIICPNHQSFLDPFVVCSTYGYEQFSNTFHVGAAMFFENRFMRWVAKMLHVVPIDQETQLMRAMKAGAAGLKNGKILNIYPEGERAYDGRLHDFKKGAAILATELDLPILPVALDGLYKVWPRRSMRIRPAKVKLRFGKPFYAKDVAAGHDEDAYAAVTEHLKSAIAEMIEEMRSGQNRDRETPI
ncbi:MAG: AMP-binding protein [Pyrinomonadaceae bacterium]